MTITRLRSRWTYSASDTGARSPGGGPPRRVMRPSFAISSPRASGTHAIGARDLERVVRLVFGPHLAEKGPEEPLGGGGGFLGRGAGGHDGLDFFHYRVEPILDGHRRGDREIVVQAGGGLDPAAVAPQGDHLGDEVAIPDDEGPALHGVAELLHERLLRAGARLPLAVERGGEHVGAR